MLEGELTQADLETLELAVVEPQRSEDSEDSEKTTIVERNTATINKLVRVARFRGRPMVVEPLPYPHYVPMTKDKFDQIGYPILGGVTRSRMSDVFAYISKTAEDLSANDRYILFGVPDEPANAVVWDTHTLQLVEGVDPDQAIWRSPYTPVPLEGRIELVLDLAGGDIAVYDDIMQSLAPIIMRKKPDGVIWWVGDGANGKSTLMDAIHRIFAGQLSSINLKHLTDERDAPALNGTLANIVKESSEGRIEDTGVYKNLGTHEDFTVHKFHSQETVTILGNIHHVFSANSIPSFNDKGHSAMRRTYIVPFTERFESDPDFETQTFTPELFGQLIQGMMEYSHRIVAQGYVYKWSAQAAVAKQDYDDESNNCEMYIRQAMDEGMVGFDSFNPLRMDYENWCADNGLNPLGLRYFRKAVLGVGFDRVSIRSDDTVIKQYVRSGYEGEDLIPFGLRRPGLYSISGFQVVERAPEVEVPEFDTVVEEEAPKPAILGGRW